MQVNIINLKVKRHISHYLDPYFNKMLNIAVKIVINFVVFSSYSFGFESIVDI